MLCFLWVAAPRRLDDGVRLRRCQRLSAPLAAGVLVAQIRCATGRLIDLTKQLTWTDCQRRGDVCCRQTHKIRLPATAACNEVSKGRYCRRAALRCPCASRRSIFNSFLRCATTATCSLVATTPAPATTAVVTQHITRWPKRSTPMCMRCSSTRPLSASGKLLFVALSSFKHPSSLHSVSCQRKDEWQTRKQSITCAAHDDTANVIEWLLPLIGTTHAQVQARNDRRGPAAGPGWLSSRSTTTTTSHVVVVAATTIT